MNHVALSIMEILFKGTRMYTLTCTAHTTREYIGHITQFHRKHTDQTLLGLLINTAPTSSTNNAANHWVALVVDYSLISTSSHSKCAWYLDPLGSPCDGAVAVFVNHVLEQAAAFSGAKSTRLHLWENTMGIQSDGFSCGWYSLLFLQRAACAKQESIEAVLEEVSSDIYHQKEVEKLLSSLPIGTPNITCTIYANNFIYYYRITERGVQSVRRFTYYHYYNHICI